jgi:hypothetical protein
LVDKKRLHESWKGNKIPKPKPVKDAKRQTNKAHGTNRRGVGK